MKVTNTLIALAIGAALATPAFAQQDKGKGQTDASMQAQVKAPVPNPVPAVDSEIVDHGKPATRGAMNNANEGAQPQAAQDAKAMQDTNADAPMANPMQSQGAEHAAAHATVVERGLWTKLDVDNDGSISATEASADAGFNGGFGKMDADGNGTVSQAEYEAYAKTNLNTGGENANAGSQAATKLTWANVDTDKDGKVSATEADAYAGIKANFSGMDGNGDGFVTQDEYRAYAKASHKP